ncbi:MAG TPA: protein kinase [Candidatus Sulfotelmatobacter sp.]|nr:protein kinase [Candidatus Sulfotelmatobacter sp.]
MKAQRWQHVRAILDRAIELPVPERSRYIDENCADDPGLRDEVESLLRSHEEAGSLFLKHPAANLTTAALGTSKSSRIGCRIGVYQILTEIGHGGMGEVYRALRADGQYEKAVAIKLVRGGFDSGLLLERFRHERQILASLDHPNIARLLDGGTTEDGIPYLVMELIEGQRLDSYCDTNQLSITQRLHLFRQICSAVQYAHQRLVVHRDLKPGNVLVTSDGVPKLLDFGIAKLIDPDSLSETTLVRPMTPEYASPEQIRGEAITTASDVYSLGVVLYQLLTGRSPYPGDTRSSHQLAKAVCETDPAKPSSVVLRPIPTASEDRVRLDTPDHLSGIREGSPAKLQRRLAGDLDNIVLKAMRKEPHQRYTSVEQLAEDIRRHLEGLPVIAVKGSLAYRADKFIRRNRMGITAGALLAITLLGGIAATIRQARIARRQAEIAGRERARAEKRFSDVRELANSLIFEIHDSIQSLPGATPSRKLLLDRAVQYLDKLSSDSSGDINLQRELAWAYHRLATVQGDTTQSNLGQVHAAEISNRKAMTFFEAVAKANPNDVTDQLNLAMAYRWRAFFDVYETTGRTEIDRALAVTEPLLSKNPNNIDVKNELAQEYFIRADIQDAAGDRLDAIESYRRVRDLRQEILRTNPGYPGARQALAKVTVMLAHEMGRFGPRDEALRLMNLAVADFEALVKETGDPGLIREVAAGEARRGDVEMIEGDLTAARKDFQSAAQRIERLAKLDPENKMLQSDIWVGRFEYGRVLAVGSRYAEALPVLEEAFRGYESLHLEADVGPGPPAMQAWIGEAQAGTRDLPGALKSFEAAAAGLAEDQGNFDDARCDLAMVETKIANVLLKMDNPIQAKEHYDKALTTAKLPVSIEHNDFPALYAAAEAYFGLVDVALAEARMTDAVPARENLTSACASYQSGLDAWKRIPHPSRYTGNGYLSRNPDAVSQQMAICKTK